MPIRLPNVELLTTNLCNVLVMMDNQARSFFFLALNLRNILKNKILMYFHAEARV